MHGCLWCGCGCVCTGVYAIPACVLCVGREAPAGACVCTYGSQHDGTSVVAQAVPPVAQTLLPGASHARVLVGAAVGLRVVVSGHASVDVQISSRLYPHPSPAVHPLSSSSAVHSRAPASVQKSVASKKLLTKHSLRPGPSLSCHILHPSLRFHPAKNTSEQQRTWWRS